MQINPCWRTFLRVPSSSDCTGAKLHCGAAGAGVLCLWCLFLWAATGFASPFWAAFGKILFCTKGRGSVRLGILNDWLTFRKGVGSGAYQTFPSRVDNRVSSRNGRVDAGLSQSKKAAGSDGDQVDGAMEEISKSAWFLLILGLVIMESILLSLLIIIGWEDPIHDCACGLEALLVAIHGELGHLGSQDPFGKGVDPLHGSSTTGSNEFPCVRNNLRKRIISAF